MTAKLEPNLIDLHSKSVDRINSRWQTSVLVNALTVGWVVAIYAGLMKAGTPHKVTLALQLALTFLHLPPYVMSCLSLVGEYRILDALNKQLLNSANALDSDDAQIVQSFAKPALLLRAPNVLRFVVLIHVIYGLLIYSIVWFPGTYLQ